MAADSNGNIYIAETYNHCIRKMTPDGTVSTIAGVPGKQGSQDGNAKEATFNYCYGIAVGYDGSIFVADTYNYTIRRISVDGIVSTLAGSAGKSGYVDGNGNDARFSDPQGICVNSKGIIFVADRWNNCIRRITQDGTVTTFAGSGKSGFMDGTLHQAQFNNPYNITVDGNDFYVADYGNNRVRK